MSVPTIGLMLGDATGIGPEICAKVLAAGKLRERVRLVVVGDARVLALGARDAGIELAWRAYDRVADVDWNRPEVPILDLRNLDPTSVTRGQVESESGRVTGDTLAYMIQLALAGEIDGITFAPLNKAGLNKGGWRYPDEHQMFAKLTNHEGYYGEMNVLEVCGHLGSPATSRSALRWT